METDPEIEVKSEIQPTTSELVEFIKHMTDKMLESHDGLMLKLDRCEANMKKICDRIDWFSNTVETSYKEPEPKPKVTSYDLAMEEKVKNWGYIAKMNEAKTEIENIFVDRKVTVDKVGEMTIEDLDTAIENDTLLNGSYYMVYENCDEKLKRDFIVKYNDGPVFYRNGVLILDTGHD